MAVQFLSQAQTLYGNLLAYTKASFYNSAQLKYSSRYAARSSPCSVCKISAIKGLNTEDLALPKDVESRLLANLEVRDRSAIKSKECLFVYIYKELRQTEEHIFLDTICQRFYTVALFDLHRENKSHKFLAGSYFTARNIATFS